MSARSGIYFALKGNGHPLLDAQGHIVQQQVDALARWGTVILDIWPVVFRPDILTALRQRNPQICLICYVMGGVHSQGQPWSNLGPKEQEFMWQFSKIVTDSNGHLATLGGGPFNVNLANHATASWLGDHTANAVRAGGWDGVFLDVWCPDLSGNNTWIDYAKLTPLVSNWQDYNVLYNAGWKLMRDRIRAGLPHLPIIGNYGPGPGDPAAINGWMRENFPYQNGGTWDSNMQQTTSGQRGYLRDAKEYVAPVQSWLVTNPVSGGPAANQQKHRFGYGSALLGSGFHSFWRHESDQAWMAEHASWWFPEYELDLGEPLGGPIKRPDALWERSFEGGRVLVNPTGQAITAPAAHGRGKPKSVTVAPSDAVFL